MRNVRFKQLLRFFVESITKKTAPNQIFLLGAGFTEAIIGSEGLLATEIFEKLNFSKTNEFLPDALRFASDIEQFITYLDLQFLRLKKVNGTVSDKIKDLRERIIEQIVALFDVAKLNISNLNDKPLLKSFIKIIPKDAHVFTLNYDCVLDQGLYLSNRWSPRGGYCIESFPANSRENEQKDNIFLLKLHGSVNFRLHPERKNGIAIEISEKIFPCSNSHINIPSVTSGTLNKQPYILAMTYLKEYNNDLYRIWDQAISALKEADRLTIIGCSLREEDNFLRYALRHFGEKNSNTFRIDIVDTNEKTRGRIKEILVDDPLVANPDKQKVFLFNDLNDFLSRQATTA